MLVLNQMIFVEVQYPLWYFYYDRPALSDVGDTRLFTFIMTYEMYFSDRNGDSTFILIFIIQKYSEWIGWTLSSLIN